MTPSKDALPPYSSRPGTATGGEDRDEHANQPRAASEWQRIELSDVTPSSNKQNRNQTTTTTTGRGGGGVRHCDLEAGRGADQPPSCREGCGGCLASLFILTVLGFCVLGIVVVAKGGLGKSHA